MGKRRKAREVALQCLYELEFGEREVAAVLRDQVARRGSSADSEQYAARLIDWVLAEQGELDRLIDARLEHWAPERVSMISRLLLRLGLAEGRGDRELPIAIILDEMVELARKFETEESAQFVNGVLDPLLASSRAEDGA